MPKPPVQSMQTYLLPRVVDIIRIRMNRQTCPMQCTPLPPHCFQFESGALSGTPTLESVCLKPTRGGCCLEGQVCLPVCLHLMRECEFFTQSGVLLVPVTAMLRCGCQTPLQFYPQAEICIWDVQLTQGALCVTFDVTMTIYAACLTPVQLPIVCAPCAGDCQPFFDMPLYPELPKRCC